MTFLQTSLINNTYLLASRAFECLPCVRKCWVYWGPCRWKIYPLSLVIHLSFLYVPLQCKLPKMKSENYQQGNFTNVHFELCCDSNAFWPADWINATTLRLSGHRPTKSHLHFWLLSHFWGRLFIEITMMVFWLQMVWTCSAWIVLTGLRKTCPPTCAKYTLS